MNYGKGVYKLIRYGEEYSLVYDRPYLEVPPKIYGKSAKYAAHFFSTFLLSEESCGAMLIGAKGSGKTELSNMIGNIAINHDLFVVEVTNIDPTTDIINYLDNLIGCVIIFDEFGKVFEMNLQDKMLTMFSHTANKKFFVITDNDPYRISGLLIDRPGRIRYHLDMNRVEEDVVLEYCEDKGTTQEFLNELLRVYKSSTIFSFDHLKALVSEHLIDKSVSIEDIIKILNVKILGKTMILRAISVIPANPDDKSVYEITNNKTIERDAFNKGSRYYIQWKKIDNKDEAHSTFAKSNAEPSEPRGFYSEGPGNGFISYKDVVDINEENRQIICKKNNIKIILEIEEV